MAYQVLARKWRPKNFHEVMGQQHVLQALSNALDQGRLHHAYLFSGTRGVGKTTIARILAKCLNCETGITSRPCGQCSACREIDQGNFVDLLEIDAASRTKVEDTRDLLENVQYKPARGRFKIYLIDEVHMLSRHSFNALLKTLEEPPEHVKFLLATTDPQKLPITILSRCLQFHLKALSQEQIIAQLRTVLSAENLSTETSALSLLAKAAQGSMRDALSLTDQAIAFGNGQLDKQMIQQMLGTMDHRQLTGLLSHLARRDAPALMQLISELVNLAPDYDQVFSELASLLHRIAVWQLLGQSIPSETNQDGLQELAELIQPEEIQLFYQIALQGRKELPFSPDGRTALEMTFLRMLAFAPRSEAEYPGVAEKKTIKNVIVTPPTESRATENQVFKSVLDAPVRELKADNADDDLAMQVSLNQEQTEILAQAAMQMPETERVTPDISSSVVFQKPSNLELKTNTDEQRINAAPSSGVEDVLRLRNQLRSRRMQSDAMPVESIRTTEIASKRTVLNKQDQQVALNVQTENNIPVRESSASMSTNPITSIPQQDDLPPWDLPPIDAYQDDFSMPDNEQASSTTPAMVKGRSREKYLSTEPVSQAQVLSKPPTIEVDEEDEAVWRSNELLSRSRDEWAQVVAKISASGRTRQLAMQSIIEKTSELQWRLIVRQEGRHLTQQRIVTELAQALSDYHQTKIELHVEIANQLNHPCPFEIEQIERVRLREEAEALLIHDPNVQFLQERFGAVLDNDTIQALKNLNKSDIK